MDIMTSLTHLGLTSQEAKLYISLHSHGSATGYEAAKLAGISRSNAYAGLASLVDKGGAHMIEGKPVRYQVVSTDEFCANRIRELEAIRNDLRERLVLADETESPYVTVKGSANITNKIHTMLENAKSRAYVAMPGHTLERFLPRLRALAATKRKVVVITTSSAELPGATIHHAHAMPSGIRIICDSGVALTGELDDGNDCTCLYSIKMNLVNLIRDSMRNEIKLIEHCK